MPFIKNEPDEYQFDSTRFTSEMNGANMFPQHNQQYGTWQGSFNDGTDFGMSGGSMRPNFGSQQNLSSSFIAGSSGIGDDELADLLGEADASQDHSGLSNGYGGHNQYQSGSAFGTLNHAQTSASMPVLQRNQYVSSVYSHTPEGAPIQSPFTGPFNYAQWATSTQQQGHNQPRRPSANLHNGSFDMGSRVRSMQPDGASSASRSPLTPKTPGTAGMQTATPDSSIFSGQPIPASQTNRGHRKTSSQQWDNTFSTGPSYMDSPMSSPHTGSGQAQIMNVMNGSKPASMPAKVEQVAQSAPPSTIEAKRQKRRQSHNAVERRRRDNINDRIQELSRLVPTHRLDDEKLTKHIRANSIYSPILAPIGMSPPPATSTLAGPSGRRAVGSISQGLPVDDKDKGPAKGDVLNGAVGWTRDLMWLLNRSLERESVYAEMLARHGEQLPPHLQLSDDDLRMQSELRETASKNGVSGFRYSRCNGSQLFVPDFTDHAGNPVQAANNHIFPTMFGLTNQGSNHVNQDNQLWEYNNIIDEDPHGLDFKEEEEFGMEME